MKSCSKAATEKQGKICWLVARWSDVGVPVKQVVSVGLWMVYDIFCWLQLMSGGFRWFAVLVVTPVSQHIEELFLCCTHERT